jgi:predicted RNase H-like nuclease (RuvC/YqgF family)
VGNLVSKLKEEMQKVEVTANGRISTLEKIVERQEAEIKKLKKELHDSHTPEIKKLRKELQEIKESIHSQ